MSKMREEHLGDLIKKAIIDSGLKQAVIAERMGLKRQTINQIDRKKTFDLEFLQKLKEASGLDFTAYIFNKKEPKEYITPVIVNKAEEPFIDNSQQVEMSLAVRIRANSEQMGKVSELIVAFHREATRLGFAVA